MAPILMMFWKALKTWLGSPRPWARVAPLVGFYKFFFLCCLDGFHILLIIYLL